MTFLKNKLTIVLLCALVVIAASQATQGGSHVSQGGPHGSQAGSHESQGGSHVSQGGAHENQARVRRQAQNEEGFSNWINGPKWTTCDAATTPTISCQDCTTRLICKPIGGLLMSCHPSRPYCNKGVCSADPAEGC